MAVTSSDDVFALDLDDSAPQPPKSPTSYDSTSDSEPSEEEDEGKLAYKCPTFGFVISD